MERYGAVVGIDLARRSAHKAVVLHDDGSAPRRAFSFGHDLEGFNRLCKHILRRAGCESLDGVVVNMEPTGGGWEVLALYLKTQGAQVYFTRPDVVSQMRKVQSRHAKNDHIDGCTLARIALTFPARLIPVVQIEPRLRVLRELNAQRFTLSQEISRWKHRYVSRLEKVWQGLLASLNTQQRFSSLGREFFTTYSDPRRVVRLGRSRFMKWCAARAHGNTDPEFIETLWQGANKAAELWNHMQTCGALALDWECYNMMLRQDLLMIETLENQQKLLDKRIAHARRKVPECDTLEQMPGFGPVIAPSVASILMPTTRFASTKQCSAFTGFTGRQKASAGRKIDGLRITKTGNKRLKRNLVLAAETAMKADPQLAQFAIRLLRAGKHYNQVRVAIGRKLALRAYSLLKRYQAGRANVSYQWRDLKGRPVTRKEARQIAAQLWHEYKKHNKKGNPPKAA